MVKNKFLIFLIFFFVFIGLGASYAFALEVYYPNIPGLPNMNGTFPQFSDYVAYLFGFMIYLAAAISLVMFTIGAVKLIGAGATGNPSKTEDAKDQMKGAVLGLILSASSFLILGTIDTNFETISMNPLLDITGVSYTNGTEQRPAPRSESNVFNRPKELMDGNFNTLIYNCKDDPNSAPVLLIWLFPKPGLEKGNSDYAGIKVVRKKCGESQSIIGVGSFKMTFETSGVYYCLGGCSSQNTCSGYMSEAHSVNQNKIPDPFNKKTNSIRIVNNTKDGIYFGAILHKKEGVDSVGRCSVPLINTTDNIRCFSVDIAPNSINIFKWNNQPIPTLSGSGVDFYSEPHGYSQGAQERGEGFCKINNEDIGHIFKEEAEKLLFDKNKSKYDCDYTSNKIDLYRFAHTDFKDKPGSIKINGSYLTALYDSKKENVWYTTYVHLNKIYVSPGQILEKGQLIGEVGAVSLVNPEMPPHLHFTVEWPSKYFSFLDPGISFNIYDKISAPAGSFGNRLTRTSSAELPAEATQEKINTIKNTLSFPLNTSHCNWAEIMGSTTHTDNLYWAQDLFCYNGEDTTGINLFNVLNIMDIPKTEAGLVYNASGGPNVISTVIAWPSEYGEVVVEHKFIEDDSGEESHYCQVFNKNVPNLKVEPFVATGHKIGDIYIIPTK